MKQELLYLYNICWKKGYRRVLRHVALTLFQGEILGVLGQNDSSLFALCQVLSGVAGPDSGIFWYDGARVSFRNMMEARQNGIYLIQKESALFSNLTVAENIGGLKPIGRDSFLYRRRRLKQEIWEFLEENEIPISLDSHIDELSLFDRCQVEIARALYNHARVLIFYQVGGEFSTEESQLFGIWLKKLKELGISVIYMDTSVDNLTAAADRLAVVTAGKVAGVLRREDYDSRNIQKILVRQQPEPSLDVPGAAGSKETAFRTSRLRVSGTGLCLDLQVQKGEIVGVYADSQTASALFQGMAGERPMEGSIWVGGRYVDGAKWDRPARYGVGCVSHTQGENFDFPNLSVYENLMIRSYRDHSRLGLLNWRILKFIAEENFRFYKISPEQTIMELQQTNHLRNMMFPLISWIVARPRLLVLSTVLETADEVEKRYLRQLLLSCRGKGIAVLYCMNREQDAMRICDRIYDLSSHAGPEDS